MGREGRAKVECNFYTFLSINEIHMQSNIERHIEVKTMGKKSSYRKLLPSEVYGGVSGRTGKPYFRVKWSRKRR
jgi:hypothetical protein